jgi:hypothetical protein
VIRWARACDAGRILKLQYLCYQTEAELYDDYAILPLSQTIQTGSRFVISVRQEQNATGEAAHGTTTVLRAAER